MAIHSAIKSLIEQILEEPQNLLQNSLSVKISMKENFNIRSEYSRLLNEAKIDIALDHYKDDPLMTAFLKELKHKNVLPKYIPWLIKMVEVQKLKSYYKWPGEWEHEAYEWSLIVERFEKFLKLNQIPQEKKDISQFKSVDELSSLISNIEDKYKQKTAEKEAQKKTDKIYQDETYLIIEPKSKEASCVYGRGTQWCISATQSQNYFDEYAERGARFLFIINKKTGDKDAIAFAGDIPQVEIYDAEDDEKKPAYIENKYDKTILTALNNFLKPNIGKDPFVSLTFDEIKQDPKLVLDWGTFYNIVNAHPEKGLKIVEILATCSRDGWTSHEKGSANQKIRQGIEMIIDSPYFNEIGVAQNLIRIHKLNPREYRLSQMTLEKLAVKIISYQESLWSDMYVMPLVFYPVTMKQILDTYLANPKDNLPVLGRIIGLIEKFAQEIRPSGTTYMELRRTWETIIEDIKNYDENAKTPIGTIAPRPDRVLKRLQDVGNKYNWDFVKAALDKVK